MTPTKALAVRDRSRAIMSEARVAAPQHPDATILVRCSSHRARMKLTKLAGPLQSYFSWRANGEWYYVPAGLADAALSIAGINRARPRSDLQRTIRL
jgi:hypothetical protein